MYVCCFHVHACMAIDKERTRFGMPSVCVCVDESIDSKD